MPGFVSGFDYGYDARNRLPVWVTLYFPRFMQFLLLVVASAVARLVMKVLSM